MTPYLLILCNCPDDSSAQRITESLLSQQLVACINRLPDIRSSYRWQGQIEHSVEIQLQLKAPAVNFTAIEQAILAIHPYTVPEIIALPLTRLHAPYGQWINEVTLGDH
ncbi:divalent-cation tolerance protein CutA [Alishewanella sp. 16-MA]|uniref:Divalent-cation tolerance protein CutA n=1 Tax=Alishewanella maricola TaxID=2795740 RepID=A0ABS8BZB0_9ALTE|nr:MULTISPECIES: divalent-cation tolerance protein CutA [Gammaproteobacteria]MDP4946426.1 divalent-cation tolerance protein CutA [Alishewanella sp.]MDP5205735.1 divalent-cation tolerance protein CutA [Alishewanella sp. SMS9]MCB5225398.1 divalent-cation tolerance protein CutA [Alishewanella maricola]MCF4008340.1 divalent-cation tolerance protein CutA [Rheinheimera sp. UJ63]MDP5036819.1 divalent-cation tolerance protein CutA [Alishewanella sp.]